MKYLKQFCIILAFSFAGEILHMLLPFPVPAGIYGIILLFIGLLTNIIPLSAVQETGNFLIEIIPAAVGLIEVWDEISRVWWQYLLFLIVSTGIVMGVAGTVTQRIVRKTKKGENEDAGNC